MNRNNSATTDEPKEIDSIWVLGAQLTWAVLGPMALVLTTIGIVSHRQGWTTYVDALLGIIVVMMVLGRWAEMRSGCARTAQGEPATWKHCKHYVTVLLPSGLLAWIIANLFGNHILAQ